MVAVRERADDVNEIEMYQDMRSIGSAEGCWRTFNFDMYSRSPVVARLQCHLPNLQRVQFAEGTEPQAAEDGPPTTTLTAWLDYLRLHPEARISTDTWSAPYCDFPEHYTYDKKEKAWKPLQKYPPEPTVGRLYAVHPSAGESFYLRMLLHKVPGSELELLDVADDALRVADQFTLEAFKYVGRRRCQARVVQGGLRRAEHAAQRRRQEGGRSAPLQWCARLTDRLERDGQPIQSQLGTEPSRTPASRAAPRSPAETGSGRRVAARRR